MKKIHPIEALIEQGEHQQLDFKFEVSDSKKIARTLSAFANTDGGRLLIGVKDNGNISGVRSEEGGTDAGYPEYGTGSYKGYFFFRDHDRGACRYFCECIDTSQRR